MSLMQRLFGGSGGRGGQQQAPNPAIAIQKLRETEEMLNKKSEFFEAKIEEQIKIAKKAGTKNKRGTLQSALPLSTSVCLMTDFFVKLFLWAVALQALKRKKRFEKQLQQIDGTLSTIEFQREALENARSNTEVLNSMGYAATALRDAHQNL